MLAASSAALALFATAGFAEGESEPEVCRDAVARRGGEALEALAAAEQESWRRAGEAEREGRKLAKESLGAGQSDGAIARAGRVNAASERQLRAIREARTFCGCRESRGDPLRTDCDSLYRKWLPSRRSDGGPAPAQGFPAQKRSRG